MAIHQFTSVPELAIDDGVAFIFFVKDPQKMLYLCGFMHRPTEPPTGNPSVLNLSSWVETLKYCARNNKMVQINFDDTKSIFYNAWWGDELKFFRVNWLNG